MLRQYRLAAGLSQEKLAERAGLSTRGISDLERGARTNPRLETVRMLAEGLGLDAEERERFRIAALGDRVDRGYSAAVASLPRVLVPLIGRQREVDELTALLQREDIPLVTLTGPGGVGKTSLALAVALQLADAFEDGIAFVPLAPVPEAKYVPFFLAEAIGLSANGGSITDAVEAHLRHRHKLLVIDNFEHVLDAAPVISHLLASCPRITVLATSRERLLLRGEQVRAVQPLGLPESLDALHVDEAIGIPAVRLFVERARDMEPSFRLTPQNMASVLEICRRLDGLPLALELAAAWVHVLPPAELLGRLDRRLTLLSRGTRDAPARQQALRDTIDWSWNLLPEPEQRMFRCLAVFAGGFDVGAAEAVAGSLVEDAPGTIAMVASLAGKSLLQRAGDDGSPRFRLLETVRAFALEKLAESGEEEAVRARHARYYVYLGEQAEVHLLREVESDWLNLLEMDHDNLRAALLWTLEPGAEPGRASLGVRLAGALWLFWYYHSHLLEGRWWLERALAVAPPGEDAARAKVLVGLGLLAHAQGDEDRSLSWLTEGLGLLRSGENTWGTAFALSIRGNLAEDAGLYDEAETYFREANTLFAATDDGVNVAVTLYHLGIVAFGQGKLTLAEDRFVEALRLSRRMRDSWGKGISLAYLGLVQSLRGEVAPAAASLDEALALFAEIGSTDRIADTVSRIAVLVEAVGEHGAAIRLFSTAEALAERVGAVSALPERDVYADARAAATSALSDIDLATYYEAGAERSLTAAMADARAALERLGETGGVRVRSGAGQGTPLASASDGEPDAVLERSGTPASPRSVIAGPLSRRELDVLRLIAEGRTNREIAVRLYISVRTVTTHVSSIFSKLGVSSRTAAVAVARARDLL